MNVKALISLLYLLLVAMVHVLILRSIAKRFGLKSVRRGSFLQYSLLIAVGGVLGIVLAYIVGAASFAYGFLATLAFSSVLICLSIWKEGRAVWFPKLSTAEMSIFSLSHVAAPVFVWAF